MVPGSPPSQGRQREAGEDIEGPWKTDKALTGIQPTHVIPAHAGIHD